MSASTVVRHRPVDASPRPAGQREGRRELAAEGLLVAALLLGWVIAYLLVFSGFEHGHAQRRLYDHLRTELALGEAPTGAPIAEGTPVALLDLPGLHHEVVVEGTTPEQLQDGVGHLLGSVLPGQQGVSVLAGRSLTFGAPFGSITSLEAGARIDVRTQEGLFHYRVEDIRRPGDRVPPPPAADGSRLILVTGGGGGPLSAARTVYVDATLDGKAQPATAVSASDPAGALMAHDAGVTTLALLALALQVLALAVSAVVWARLRWSRAGAWIVGVPVLLAALWLASSVASRLLPNLV